MLLDKNVAVKISATTQKWCAMRPSLEEWYEILTAGGRMLNEKSSAERSRFYYDPAATAKLSCEKGRRLKAKLSKEDFESLEPIDKLLRIWQDFNSLADSARSGGYANPQDVKDFMRVGEAVEAMISDLKRHQWWAIHKSRGICTAWIFKDAIYEDALAQAREALEKKMRAHMATARYFE
jgi:hypothetical protein